MRMVITGSAGFRGRNAAIDFARNGVDLPAPNSRLCNPGHISNIPVVHREFGGAHPVAPRQGLTCLLRFVLTSRDRLPRTFAANQAAPAGV